MAIVPDLAREGMPTDPPLRGPNRKLSGAPILLSTVPQYSGEVVLNLANGELWIARGTTASDWTPFALVM